MQNKSGEHGYIEMTVRYINGADIILLFVVTSDKTHLIINVFFYQECTFENTSQMTS